MALTTHHVLIMVVGVLLGLVVGVLPGLGAPNGVSLLLPLTFTMDPISAIILLTCMYWGALFGGSTTSILFNIPGEPSSVATTFDGYPMAKQGQAVRALTLAFASAGIGALTGVMVITLLSGWVAQFRAALRRRRNISPSISWPSPASSAWSSGSPFKTLVSMMLGFACATIGMDTISGESRLTFDFDELIGGISFLVAVIGLFGIGELLLTMEEGVEVRGREGEARSRDHRPHAGRNAALLGHRSAQRAHRLLDGHHARRADRRLLHELRRRPPLLATRRAVRQGRAGRHRLAGDRRPFGRLVRAAAHAGARHPRLGDRGGDDGRPDDLGPRRPARCCSPTRPDFVWGLIASMYLGNIIAVILVLATVPLFATILRVPFTVVGPIISSSA